MDPNTGNGELSASPPAPDHATVPAQAGTFPAARPPGGPPAAEQQPGTPSGTTVPWLVLIRLGFVSVVLIIAVVLIALGYTAVAAVEVILGVGLAAVEIIRRLG